MKNDTDYAKDQARAQHNSVERMLAALDVDYGRLEELRDARDGHDPDEHDGRAWAQAFPYDAQELAELEDAAGDCADEDDARQQINDDPLSVEVRSAWQSPGDALRAAEFCILLCTGGPAVRIRGELSDRYMEPSRAWLEYQDWGTPWTEYVDADSDVLCRYASNFYFGE